MLVHFVAVCSPILLWMFGMVNGGLLDCTGVPAPPPEIDGIELLNYLEISLQCDNWEVEVTVSACKMNKIGIRSINQIFISGSVTDNPLLLPSECRFRLSYDGERGFVYAAKLNYNSCDVSVKSFLGNYKSFEHRVNLAYGGASDGIISRIQAGLITLQCWYYMEPTKFLGGIEPLAESYLISTVIDGGVSGNVTFKAYSDSALSNELSSSQPFLTIPNMFYVVAKITGASATSLILQASSCWATPSSDPNDPVRYDLIVNGCPVDDLVSSGALVVNENYMSSRVEIGIMSFMWVGFSFTQEIYTHCSLQICDTAIPGAFCWNSWCGTKRKKRAASTQMTESINGPVSAAPFSVAINPLCLPRDDGSGQCEHICTVANNARLCLCYSNHTLQEDGRSCKETMATTEIEFIHTRPVVEVVKAMESTGFTITQLATVGICALLIFTAVIYGVYFFCTAPSHRKTAGVDFTTKRGLDMDTKA